MTSNEIRLVQCGGVSCKSDAGLYLENSYRSTLKFISIYGSPQQVRAIFALLVANETIEVIDGEGKTILVDRGWYDGMRLKTFPLGYGKRHGLIFIEGLGKGAILWTSPEEKERALFSALSKRRIPFDREWLPRIEEVLVEDDQLIPLHGWGGLNGYDCSLNDDKVCDLITEKILPLYRGDRRNSWNSESSSKNMALNSAPG